MFLLPQRNKPMSIDIFNLLQTKVYVLLMFWAVYFSGASRNRGIRGYNLVCLQYFHW